MVLLAATFAIYPIAVVFDKLLEETSASYPKAVFLSPVAFVIKDELPNPVL